MTKMTKREELLHCFEEYKNEALFVAIFVQNGNNPLETIINPRENFEEKKGYYAKAYNDNLELMNNTSIKIIDFVFADRYADIQLWMEEEIANKEDEQP